MTKRQHNADRRFQEGIEDFTNSSAKLTKLIESGACTGVVNFHTIEEAGKLARIGMISGGMSQREIFDAVCIIRRSMMLMLNIAEAQPIGEAMNEDLIADDEPVAQDVTPTSADARRKSARCEACGRDGWAILGRCEHAGCPKGLYKE